MSTEFFFEKIAALQDSNIQVEELINRLSNIEFQPGSVPLNSLDDGVLSELVAEIVQIIKDQEEDLELVNEEIHDLNPGRSDLQLIRQKDKLGAEVQTTIVELKKLQKAFRRAQLIAKQKLEAARVEERAALTKSYLEYEQASRNISHSAADRLKSWQKPLILSKEEKEINASSNVTAALRRTHDLMVNELSRSQFAHDTLRESTEALAQLAETYSTLDTLLLTSRNLLGTLLRSQKSDTWYLETAFYILLSTICWLVFRRLLYGPILWLIWYPIKLLIKSSKRVIASTS